jgi:hypothetical protein
MNDGDVSSERSWPCQEECGINWVPDPQDDPFLHLNFTTQLSPGRVVYE